MPTSVPPHSGVDRNRRASAQRLKRRKEQPRGHRGKQPPQNQLTTSPLPLLRLLLVWGVLMAASLGLAVNLFKLQVVRAPELVGKARQQQMVYLRPFIPRRPVVDRNHNVLAMERPVYTLYAHPKLFNLSKEAIATELAPILNRSPADLVKQFNTRTSGIKIALSLSEEIADQIALLRLNGLEVLQQIGRAHV